MRVGWAWVLGAAMLLGGCTRPQQPDAEQVKREAAQDTKELRKDLRQASDEAQKAADQARVEAKAAVAGATEGWKQGEPGHAGSNADESPVDVNSASAARLEALPGITAATAERIVRGRPYDDPGDLLKRGILSRAEYARVRDRLVAR